jgi:hypothetical protein
MTNAINSNQVAAIMASPAAQTLAAAGFPVANLVSGAVANATGGGTAAAPAAGTAAAAAVPGVITPGLLGATPTTDPAILKKADEILSNNGTLSLTTTSVGGSPVTVLKTKDGFKLQAPTGRNELVQVEGKQIRFDAQGVSARSFQLVQKEQIPVDLDRRQGISTGINNLSKVIAGRQERLKLLSEALAQDSSDTGSTNQLDIQQLVQEQQVTEHLSNMNHKIYESVQNAITPWLR